MVTEDIEALLTQRYHQRLLEKYFNESRLLLLEYEHSVKIHTYRYPPLTHDYTGNVHYQRYEQLQHSARDGDHILLRTNSTLYYHLNLESKAMLEILRPIRKIPRRDEQSVTAPCTGFDEKECYGYIGC